MDGTGVERPVLVLGTADALPDVFGFGAGNGDSSGEDFLRCIRKGEIGFGGGRERLEKGWMRMKFGRGQSVHDGGV